MAVVDTTEAYLHETCQGLFSLCRQTVEKVSWRSTCGLPWVDVLSIPQARGCLCMKINFHISILLLCSSFTVCMTVSPYWIGKPSRRGTASALSLAD